MPDSCSNLHSSIHFLIRCVFVVSTLSLTFSVTSEEYATAAENAAKENATKENAPDTNATEKNSLDPLVKLLSQIEDPTFQLDLLKGMREGIRGRKSVPMPKGWSELYQKLAQSKNAEVREHSQVLAVAFGDPLALASLRETMLNSKLPLNDRKQALEVLVEKQTPDLADDLQSLIADQKLRSSALKGLATYNDPNTSKLILKAYSNFSADDKQDAMNTLASRATYALDLLQAIEQKEIPASDLSAYTARQIQMLGNQEVKQKLSDVWGQVRTSSKEKQKRIAEFKKKFTSKELAKADISKGRLIFSNTCMKCHKLFGEGGKIGPDITGANRNNLDYLFENMLDPSAMIGKDYRMNTIITVNGRVLTGIIVERSPKSLTIQTVNDRIVLSKEDIDEMEESPVSMMPEGQLDKMSTEEIRNLIRYLQSKSQVALPPGVKLPQLE